MLNNETICAIATNTGGAIGIIRISGINALEIISKIFKPVNHNINKEKIKPNTIILGNIFEDKQEIDQVLLSYFKAPNSFTGEDIVEISFHGSDYIAQKILALLMKNGAMPAKKGEFTQRAFLNGKIDLSQAEAIADMIAAKSEMAHKIAVKQLKGEVANEIKTLRKELIDFASLIELELDFAEEDVEFADKQKFKELISLLIDKINKLCRTFELGNALKQGVPVAIIGEPNVGKSTLLNKIINENRAIVSDMPGTTRDTIEQNFYIEGINFRFIDTAGLRNTDDIIEKEGIERTIATVENAMIVIILLDATQIQDKNIEGILQQINYNSQNADNIMLATKYIFAINKIDKIEAFKVPALIENNETTILISAKKDINIEALKQLTVKLTLGNISVENETIISNARQANILKKSNEHLIKALNDLNNNTSIDLINIDIRAAIYHLGEITGEISSEDLLENIFTKFCIGK